MNGLQRELLRKAGMQSEKLDLLVNIYSCNFDDIPAIRIRNRIFIWKSLGG
jgi:hypothetical protein